MCPKELVETRKFTDRNRNKIYATSLVNALSLLSRIEDPIVESLSLLHKAAKYGDARLVRHFLREGFDVNLQAGPKLLSPLHLAAIVSNYETIEELLANGADASLQSTDKITAIQYVGLFNLLNIQTVRISIRQSDLDENGYVLKRSVFQEEQSDLCLQLLSERS